MNKRKDKNIARVDNNDVTSIRLKKIEDPFSKLEKNVKSLMTKNAELLHEIDTFKKKSESDNKRMLLNFIEVLDSFENILSSIKPKMEYMDDRVKAFIRNCETIFEMLSRVLSDQGIIPIETIIGKKVNPYWHNIVEVVESPDREDGIIVEEVRKGYVWNKKIIRAADVKVVRNPV